MAGRRQDGTVDTAVLLRLEHAVADIVDLGADEGLHAPAGVDRHRTRVAGRWRVGDPGAGRISERHRAEEDLRAARHRVVQAVVEERQRLERDLHDGAQQRLVSLGISLARARTALPDDPNRAAAVLDEAIVALEEAAVELRNLARGIHPKSLTHFGLTAALRDVASRSPIDLELGAMPAERYPLAIEATAYFVVSEALTNVARYAGTGRAWVEVAVEEAVPGPGELVVTVGDDGPGGASLDAGTGLRGLADRVAMLDGSLHVDSPQGGGTTLRARIPLPRSVVVRAPQPVS